MTIAFFERVEFSTNKFWQTTGRDLSVDVSNEVNNPELRFALYEYFDKVDIVRCFLGMQAEWLEHQLNPGIDEFSDIIFYTARVANYFGISQVKYNAHPLSRADRYLNGMVQPVRNMLRPTALKDKHYDILMYNLNAFIGTLFAHMRFAGYTEDEIVAQLNRKLAPRYK